MTMQHSGVFGSHLLAFLLKYAVSMLAVICIYLIPIQLKKCTKLKLMIKIVRQFARIARQLPISQQSTTPLITPIQYCFASKTFPLPFLADSINEGTIAQFVKKEGQWVQLDETVANVETDKVTVQIKSPTAGIITKFHVAQGDNLGVGKPLFDVDPDAPKPAGSATPKAADKKSDAPKSSEQGKPTETKEAVKETPKTEKPKSDAPKQTAPILSGQRTETREPMSRLRQRVSQRLKQAQNTYALLTTFQQVDMSQAQKTRQQLGEDFLKKYNIKLGFMSFFLKAATLALQQYPTVNSVIDGTEIVRRNFIDISVAVATPTGLLVPVLRNCQNMKFQDFQFGLAQLAKKGKEGKITIEDMQGGTFTISNGGTFGSLMGTPIINPPQTAILGMHSIINRPVVRGDEIVARPMMYLALTYDHRLLDGKDAVLFLKRIQNLVQNPKRMLLQI